MSKEVFTFRGVAKVLFAFERAHFRLLFFALIPGIKAKVFTNFFFLKLAKAPITKTEVLFFLICARIEIGVMKQFRHSIQLGGQTVVISVKL